MFEVALVGLGYFSQFHMNAWQANPDATLSAVCDPTPGLATEATALTGAIGYRDSEQMFRDTDPDIVDLVVPPSAQAKLIRMALRRDRLIICQKPFCTSLEEAKAITAEAEAAGATLVIHENFRFQPWYRTAKRFLHNGRMGQVYGAQFRLRPGDGRGADAYMARQPSFQQMPRFLVQETAVHLIDTFRYLFGPVASIYADLRQLNPAIAGEDAGHIVLTHDSGVQSVFDGNRLADSTAADPRRTMGEMLVEGEGGALRLDGDGRLHYRAFGQKSVEPVLITDRVDNSQFGGGCVAALINHAVTALSNATSPENTARDYLTVVELVEAAYRSAAEGRRIAV
ncbi:Oxidoreductase [Candidatus Rhodobacter oscarellae]|uniref:Oxidoreductase n=1 Tax=Candidatus Rhodobacter oscarellae TaxID=1675527 RepID=A0A0J9H2X8_9RHOB|nr:Gfo/Idh/MocA family oxidoreductase [Candidatus Rhodobacter lobularis]KMW60038.1 Oxidoreductase [Candidatus Rhodobacter lobularis]